MKNFVFIFVLFICAPGRTEPFDRPPQQAELCGRLTSLSFVEKSGRIDARAYMDRIKSFPEKHLLPIERVILTDPKTVFKVSKVVAQTSVQDGERLKESLNRSQFEWDYLVGPELHPYPYEEDYELCVRVDLSYVDGSTLPQVIAILDLLEDGHSIFDLLDPKPSAL